MPINKDLASIHHTGLQEPCIETTLPNHTLARLESRHAGADLYHFAGDIAAEDGGIVERHERIGLHLGRQ